MASPLKEVYSPQFIDQFYVTLRQELPDLNQEEFRRKVFAAEWEQLELKQRMTRIAEVLKAYLDPAYPKAVEQLCRIVEYQQKTTGNGFNFEFMFIPEFVIRYGQDHYQASVEAMERITQYTSCEFAVRHFIVKYPERMISQMQAWAQHPHDWVRRLASEGMRTRLPWAISVKELKENPSRILPILDKLIADPSDWVRLSVANSLNDLSKDYPQITLEFAGKWKGHSTEVDRKLKHALRGLLKKGDPSALALFGVDPNVNFNLLQMPLLNKEVKIGEYLHFKVRLKNEEKRAVSLRLEYRVYFLRGNGTHHPKTFKITEKELQSGEILELGKKHSFKEITTRKFYPGGHRFALLVNGTELGETTFELKF